MTSTLINFFCDSNTPTTRLGLRNRKISFDEITKMTITNRENDAMDADAVGLDDSDPADEDMVATDTAAQAPVEKRPVGAIEDVSAPSEQPAAKRQRVLRMMNSEEVTEAEDQDAADLEQVIVKIKWAARKFKWYMQDASCLIIHHHSSSL